MIIATLVLLVVVNIHYCSTQSLRDSGGSENVLEIINSHPDLSEFAEILDLEGLHRAFFGRQVTLFAPNNAAIREFTGRRTESLILNHMANVALTVDQFPEKLISLVTGNPPLWISRSRRGVFVNQAKLVRSNIRARSDRGDEQILHIIDSVLEPLVPTSARDAEYFVQLDAYKLLTKSTLYNLGQGVTTRVFNSQAEINKKQHMFEVPGAHTFFLPVDSSFDLSVQLSGYDHDRSRLRGQGGNEGATRNSIKLSTRVRKELVDARVIEGHIIPHRLLFTSLAPTPEYPTVAWLQDGIQVNASLQSTSLDGDASVDVTIANLHNLSPQHRTLRNVVVRSNTIVGDRVHSRGMVVARIVRGNIPVQNGVVHLIDKPLMIVAKTMYEFIMEEGRQPGNRLSRFAQLLRDKGGLFAQAILEAKDGTLLAPSNAAFDSVDQERFDFVLGNDYLRAEMLGLHFVRERIVSNDHKITASGDETFSTPASLPANRVWFHRNKAGVMTVEARGVNASVLEKDIGTVNGVIQIVDRVLGVPYQTVWQKISDDPNMSHMASLLKQLRLDELFSKGHLYSQGRYTVVVPSNQAWEKAMMHFTKAYNTLMDGQFPNYGKGIIERHFKIADHSLTFEELEEMTRTSPRRLVQMMGGSLTFVQQGEFQHNAYKRPLVTWRKIHGQVIRPNVECTNGIIHLVDTVFIDDAPPWTVGGTKRALSSIALLITAIFVSASFG